MDIQTKLYEKMWREQIKFIDELLKKTPQEVMESAYEKVIRDDILMIFEGSDFEPGQLKELMKLKYPLAACYDNWLKTDCSHMEMLRDTIDDFSKRMKEQDKKKHREPER